MCVCVISGTKCFFRNVINEEEFLLLNDINTSKNRELPYYNYD